MKNYLINILVLIIIILWFLGVCISFKHVIDRQTYLKELEKQINELRFELEYLEFVEEDTIKQIDTY